MSVTLSGQNSVLFAWGIGTNISVMVAVSFKLVHKIKVESAALDLA
jgi:hypothetical protein